MDDGAFDRHTDRDVPVAAVAMEGGDRVEVVALRPFPVDGSDATGFLATWIAGLRVRPTLDAVFLGGITLAGLGVVDLRALANQLALPVIALTRRDPVDHRVNDALRAAGLTERIPLVTASPRAQPLAEGLFGAFAGTDLERARGLVAASLGKSHFPEPLRLAHLIAGAAATGESHGRV